jgi:hypothetical protein
MQVVQDRAGRRLGVPEERRQQRVGLLDGRRLGLQQVQDLPVPARQARPSIASEPSSISRSTSFSQNPIGRRSVGP